MRSQRYNRVYLAAIELKKDEVRITPMILARKAGFNHPSRISATMKALEIDGLIRRINHSWHDVEIEVHGS